MSYLQNSCSNMVGVVLYFPLDFTWAPICMYDLGNKYCYVFVKAQSILCKCDDKL